MKLNLENIQFDPELAAKYCKFCLQQKNQYQIYKLPLERVASRGFYMKHKIAFDNLVKIFNKHNLNVENYIIYFVEKANKFEKDIDTDLISSLALKNYAEYIQIREKRERIYKYFLKSVKNIVEDCIRLDYTNATDYIRYLISSKTLSNYYLTGKISQYYLAAIPNFKRIIEKLDPISRDEFSQLHDRFEMYNFDINEAFLQLKKSKINPIKFTNDQLLKAKDV